MLASATGMRQTSSAFSKPIAASFISESMERSSPHRVIKMNGCQGHAFTPHTIFWVDFAGERLTTPALCRLLHESRHDATTSISLFIPGIGRGHFTWPRAGSGARDYAIRSPDTMRRLNFDIGANAARGDISADKAVLRGSAEMRNYRFCGSPANWPSCRLLSPMASSGQRPDDALECKLRYRHHAVSKPKSQMSASGIWP